MLKTKKMTKNDAEIFFNEIINPKDPKELLRNAANRHLVNELEVEYEEIKPKKLA